MEVVIVEPRPFTMEDADCHEGGVVSVDADASNTGLTECKSV